jgi:large subunit ribosomal protein L23
MKINDVFIQPVQTEKATNSVKDNVYTFHVSQRANKDQVRKTLESLYQVKVKSVHILNRKGKQKKVGKKMRKKQLPNVKIALIALKEGKINLFPQP